MTTKALERWERWFLLGLIFLSLGLRLGYLAEMSQTLFLTQLRLDELFHYNWAKSISAGNIMGDQIFFRAPLYAYWLGLNFAVFGDSYIVPRIIQHIFGVITVVLVYFLARKFFGKKTAAISSILAATYAALIYNEDKLLLESILIPQIVLFILLIYSVKDKPTIIKWSGIGILFGLICITRPIFLTFSIILILTIFLWYRKTYRKKLFAWMMTVVAGIVIVIAPVILRNYIVGKEFVLIASQGGINLYLGNNSSADGFSATMPGTAGNRWENRDIIYPAQRALGQKPKISMVDSYWQNRAFEFMVSNPSGFISLIFKKLNLFWSSVEIPNNNSFYLYEQFSIILRWLPTGFWLVGPLGLLGIWIALKQKCGRLLIGFIFLYAATIISFFVCDRFRLPVVPFLIIFAGLSVVKIWDLFRETSKRNLIQYIFLLVIFGIIVNGNFYDIPKGNRPADLFQLGNMELSDGNYSNAVSYYKQVCDTKKVLQDVHLNYGVAELRLGHIDNALEQFRYELLYFPKSYDALVNLAHLYYTIGKPDLTIYYARQAMAEKPYASNACIDMAFALSDMKRYDTADSILTTFINMYGNDALYEESVLAGIHIMNNKIDLAEKEYRSILERIKPQTQPGYEPEFQYSKEYSIGGNWEEFTAKIYYSLGHIFVQRELYDSALINFNRATNAFPKFADAWISIGNALVAMNRLQEAETMFSSGLQINPANYQGWYDYGLLMEQMNRRPEARHAFERALRVNPDFEEAKEELRKLLR